MHAYIHKLHLCVSESESDNGLATSSLTQDSIYVFSNPLVRLSKPSAGVMTSRKPLPISASSVQQNKQSESTKKRRTAFKCYTGFARRCACVHAVRCKRVCCKRVCVVLTLLRFKYRLHSTVISGTCRKKYLSVCLFVRPLL